MHTAAHQFVAEKVAALVPPGSVVEIGSRDINGTIRDLFPAVDRYVGLDLFPGPGVDWIGDAREYEPESPPDLVVCCEVFEHMAEWPGMVRRVADWLAPGGVLIVTCAGPGRRPHSAIDGGWKLYEGEHYLNVSALRLADVMRGAGLAVVEAREQGADTQALAVRP
jgi:hypothetical protein